MKEGFHGFAQLGVLTLDDCLGRVGHLYVGFELTVFKICAFSCAVADDGDAEVEGAVLISSIRRIFDYRIKN